MNLRSYVSIIWANKTGFPLSREWPAFFVYDKTGLIFFMLKITLLTKTVNNALDFYTLRNFLGPISVSGWNDYWISPPQERKRTGGCGHFLKRRLLHEMFGRKATIPGRLPVWLLNFRITETFSLRLNPCLHTSPIFTWCPDSMNENHKNLDMKFGWFNYDSDSCRSKRKDINLNDYIISLEYLD